MDTSAQAVDFNNDTRLDIVAVKYGGNNVSVLLHVADGSLGNEILLVSGGNSRVRYIAVDDFNNDTMQDIVVVNFGTKNIGVILGYGNGSFSEQMIFSAGPQSAPYSIAIGHFNEDNQLDLVVVNYDSNNIDMFRRQLTFDTRLNRAPVVVAASDFNHDRQSEIIDAYDNFDNVDIVYRIYYGSF